MNIGIGNEHPDGLLTYPDVANLSGCAALPRLAWRGAGASCVALAWLHSPPELSLTRRPVLVLWVWWAMGCTSRRVRRWMGVSIRIAYEHLDR